MSPCRLCGPLGDSQYANTGRDESLPASVRKLKPLWGSSGSNAHDLLLCPTCGAWFEFEDDTAFTGSGNNDSQTLKRLKPQAWVVLEKLLHGDVSEPRALLTDARTHLSSDLFFSVIGKVPPTAFEVLLPLLVERFFTTPVDSENHALYGTLNRVITNATLRATYLELARTHGPLPPGRAKFLVELCEKELAKAR
jgi:hypothetical protein